MWTLLLLAATVRSFAHVPLGISDRNTTTVYDKLLNANATRWEEAQAVVASLRDCPDLKKKYANSDVLTMKMIRIIQ